MSLHCLSAPKRLFDNIIPNAFTDAFTDASTDDLTDDLTVVFKFVVEASIKSITDSKRISKGSGKSIMVGKNIVKDIR